MSFYFVEVGRFPKYEVRTINQAMSNEISLGPLHHDFVDTKAGLVSEDNLQSGEEILTYNQYNGIEENSLEDGPTVHLFLYGVSIFMPCPSNMFSCK